MVDYIYTSRDLDIVVKAGIQKNVYFVVEIAIIKTMNESKIHIDS